MINTNKIADYAVENFDKTQQDLILIEEMSELTKELLKKRRSKDNYSNIVEEMAHVYISLEVVKRLFGIGDDEINYEVILKERKYGVEGNNEV